MDRVLPRKKSGQIEVQIWIDHLSIYLCACVLDHLSLLLSIYLCVYVRARRRVCMCVLSVCFCLAPLVCSHRRNPRPQAQAGFIIVIKSGCTASEMQLCFSDTDQLLLYQTYPYRRLRLHRWCLCGVNWDAVPEQSWY